MDIIVGSKRSRSVFFVVDRKPSYNALLGRDWIHANRCVPSSMHQKLVLWKENGDLETVEAESQPFPTSSNCVEAQLYQEGVGPLSCGEETEESLMVEDMEGEGWGELAFGLIGPVEKTDETIND